MLPPLLPPLPRVQNLVEYAEYVNLATLVKAVVAGGLVDTLSSPGPFTVFAPTNKAFDACFASSSCPDTLLDPSSKDQLVDILTYHVLSSQVLSTDFLFNSSHEVPTVQGSNLLVVKTMEGSVSVGSGPFELQNVIYADNLATNGVTHIIDGVMLPPVKSDEVVV